MNGISAVWQLSPPAEIQRTIRKLTSGLGTASRTACLVEAEGSGGVGCSSPTEEPQICRQDGILVAADADILDLSSLTNLVGMQAAGPTTTASLLASLYLRFGVEMFGKLRGGFSIVIWDTRNQRLIAALDGFGIKRLAYLKTKSSCWIASRVDALAKCSNHSLSINPRAIANVLNFSCNLAPETTYREVRRLTPGSVLTISNGDERLERFWDLQYRPTPSRSEKELCGKVEIAMAESVAAHCAGVPAGCCGAFLSGGVDSSTVVGLMARANNAPVKAFSIGFEHQAFNELEYARIAARAFGAQHFTYLVSANDCLKSIPAIVRQFDEPFGNSSAVPTYFCAQLAAAKGITTLLAGDGGDELFGGNERYAVEKIFQIYPQLPSALRKGLIEPLLEILPSIHLVQKARSYIRRSALPGVERLLSFQFLATHPLSQVFMQSSAESLAQYSIFDVPGQHYFRADAQDHLDRLLYVDMKITIADNDLPKVTNMASLAGLKVRFPFLDRSVADLSAQIPSRLKVKGFQKRYLFKKAFAALLPKEIRTKKKHGFGIPVAHWLKTNKQMSELLHDALVSECSLTRTILRRDCIEDLLQRHQTDTSTYYGDTLWTFLMLELWHREAVPAAAGSLV